MASSLILNIHITLCLLFSALACESHADVTMTDAVTELDWHTSLMSMYDGIDEIGMEDDEDTYTTDGRRSLFWKRMRYYISYGALSANRIPCPPRSGRSYYTHSCWRARGPPRPYTRGCSTITRCRR